MGTISADALRSLLEGVPDGFFIHDARGRFRDANAQSCADLGYSREELLALTINDISMGADPAANLERWNAAPEGMAMGFREIAVRKDGSTFPVEISLTCRTIDGEKLFFGLARDVGEREAAREAVERMNAELERRVAERTAELRSAHERMAMAARVGGLGIWDYDIATDALHCDEQWYRIMGRDPARPIATIGEFRAFIHPTDVDHATEVEATAARLLDHDQNYGISFRIIHPDGEVRWVRSAAHVVADESGRGRRVVGFVVDITESRLAEASLQQQTLEDPLTGLANRRGLDEDLARACLHAMRTGEPLTLAMFDVDHFKLYNDVQGHVSGDSALQTVAGLLKAAARRPYDLAARYGGEEFLLLLPGAEEPEALVGRIVEGLSALRIPHPASPVAPHLTVSCGCVVASELADFGPLDLLAACDRALYRAKAEGRDRIHFSRI